MRAGSLISYPPRLWEVGLVRISGRTRVVCRTCGPLDQAGWPQPSLRAGMLSHLARHARRDVTPAHLRMCQCGKAGCSWHRRHRGCAGPVVLALTHGSHSPTWQLADICHQCCAAMPCTAAVPVSPPQTAAEPFTAAIDMERTSWTDYAVRAALYGDSDDSQVWDASDTIW